MQNTAQIKREWEKQRKGWSFCKICAESVYDFARYRTICGTGIQRAERDQKLSDPAERGREKSGVDMKSLSEKLCL